MGREAPSDLSRLLRSPASGDREEALFRLAYAELRELAGSIMRREREYHTLQPTALVHEAYLRLAGSETWEGRAHFFAAAARAMRRVLVDHARRRDAEKRGGPDLRRVTFEEDLHGREGGTLDVLALDQALDRLAGLDPRMHRVVEMKLFAGLTAREIADVLGVSKRTVDGEWSFARKWLADQLS
ncbi:MAG: ECF-type sigma factor [bacterium]